MISIQRFRYIHNEPIITPTYHKLRLAILYLDRTGSVVALISTTSSVGDVSTFGPACSLDLAMFVDSCWYSAAASTTVATAKAAASFSSF